VNIGIQPIIFSFRSVDGICVLKNFFLAGFLYSRLRISSYSISEELLHSRVKLQRRLTKIIDRKVYFMAETRKNPYAVLFIGGGVLLLLATLTWVLLNKPTTPVETQTFTPTPASESEVRRVSLEDAKAALEAKSAVFLDVRDSSSYAVSHIPGAILIPLSDLSTRMSELNPNMWIITYCT
jgi:Rhodanese-like domain